MPQAYGQLRMRPARPFPLGPKFEDVNVGGILQPCGDQASMAPGCIGWRLLETQQGGDVAISKASQVAQHLVSIEVSQLRHVALNERPLIDLAKPGAWC